MAYTVTEVVTVVIHDGCFQIQANVKALTSERDSLSVLYEEVGSLIQVAETNVKQ